VYFEESKCINILSLWYYCLLFRCFEPCSSLAILSFIKSTTTIFIKLVNKVKDKWRET